MKQQVNSKMCAEKIKGKVINSLTDTLILLEIKVEFKRTMLV